MHRWVSTFGLNKYGLWMLDIVLDSFERNIDGRKRNKKMSCSIALFASCIYVCKCISMEKMNGLSISYLYIADWYFYAHLEKGGLFGRDSMCFTKCPLPCKGLPWQRKKIFSMSSMYRWDHEGNRWCIFRQCNTLVLQYAKHVFPLECSIVTHERVRVRVREYS